MEEKTTKQRLDDLYDLLKSEYITESEFRNARANLLKESGIDLTPRFRAQQEREREISQEERRALEDDEEDAHSSGHGCGCFLMLILLAAMLVIGALFAVPDWPDDLGGAYVRTIKSEVQRLWANDDGSKDSDLIPDPIKNTSSSRAVPAVQPPSRPKPKPVSIDIMRTSADAVTDEEMAAVDENTKTPKAAIPNSQDAPAMPETPEDMPSTDLTPPQLPKETAVPAVTSEEHGVTVIEIPPSAAISHDEPETDETPNSASLAPEVPDAAPNEVPEQPAAKLRTGFISARSARIRSTPDTSITTNVSGWGRNGDHFVVLEDTKDKRGATWYHVRYEDGSKEGWIRSDMVKIDK